MGLLRRSALLACALLACNGDSADPPSPCFDCGVPSPGVLGVNAIVVENRSDHAVPLTVRELAGGIMIDRKILEGTLAVPIGPAGRGAERGMSLDVGANAFLDAPLQVLTGPNVVANTGGVVRVGSGPFFLAVGKGTVIVRSREGADILEVEDPRSVTLLPVERDMPACTRAALGGLLADPPSPIRGAIR